VVKKERKKKELNIYTMEKNLFVITGFLSTILIVGKKNQD